VLLFQARWWDGPYTGKKVEAMMSQRGLLSRLGSGDRHIDPVQSVIEHLKVLLNTCAGESVTVPDYGLMDFSEIVHELPNGVHKIQQSIRNVILKYEPRLKNVSVRYIPDDEPLVLRFEVVARLNDPSRSLVRLRTQMSSGGTFRVI
jgi:type VI secretion system protein